MILPIPIFAIPGTIFYYMDEKKLKPKGKSANVALEIFVLACSLFIALPLSVAIFPQNGSLKAEDMEEGFKTLKRRNGEPVQIYNFNKGL